MANFTLRTTFAFSGNQQGWSESFLWQSASDDLQAAENTMTPIALAQQAAE